MNIGRLAGWVAAIALGGWIAAGCSGGSSSSASGGGKGASGKSIGVVFDSGGRGDKSFNDSAWAGVQRAQKDFGIDVHTVDSKSEKDYEGNLTALADGGANLIFAVGITQQNALEKVAPKYPNVHFASIDAEINAPNVRSLLFSEEQGSFLAGYAAALASKTKKIGFVGGMSIPLIKKFEVGYRAGAMTADPTVTVLPSKYTESWDDTSTGKAAASVLFDQGADVVYHAAGRCGLGVIDAAKEKNKLAIGVDSDQDDVAPGNVLTSMVKHVDEAVYETIKDETAGKFTPGVKRYDLAANGVGLTDFKYTKDKLGPDGLKKLDDIAAKIKSGAIKVPTTEAELASFKPAK